MFARRWLLLFACGLLVGCGPLLDEAAERRSQYALAGDGPILLAVVDDRSDPQFLNGIRLAVDEINASDERLLGRPVELLVRPGSEHFAAVRATVQEIASDPRVSAVLGHTHPDVAIPASVIYEQAKVLFLAPLISRQLTWHGFESVLRMLPNDETMTAQMASVASLFGYETLALLHSHDDHSRQEAFMFADAATQLGLEVVFRGAFFTAEKDDRALLSELIGVDIDAAVVIADGSAVARLLRQLRQLNIQTPVLVGYSPNLRLLAQQAGAAGDKTIVPVGFMVQDHEPDQRRFPGAYFNAYGCMPNQAAVLGYDSLQVFKTIVERAGTTEPRALMTTARYSGAIPGITGAYKFDANGDLSGRSFEFQVLRGGQWQDLPGVAAPFRLARFQRTTPRAREAAADATSAGRGREQRARDEAWFALSHELLGFKRLGLVVSTQDLGQIAGLGLARTMAKRLGFEVEVCELPALTPAADQQRRYRALQRCYGRLARTVDAIYVADDFELEPNALKQLNQGLLAFDVASFALGKNDDRDLGLSLTVGATGLDLTRPAVMTRFDGLLKGITLREMSKQIATTPTLEVDLQAIAQLGIRLPPRVLTLISDIIEEAPNEPYMSFTSERP